jgi:hypothetical protein
MLRPPALKAIIPVDATDDVYTDDIVYWNGALQFESLGRWPFSMIAPNGTPGYPDYDVHTEAARQRFEDEPWIFEWLRQQRDGFYWRRMSLRPRYEAIEIPTLMIGGWLDGYTDSIPRMLAEMKAPARAIVGPWPHAWPETAKPGPNIDSRRDILRFWDHWLKGNDTGLMDEPALAVYVQRWYPPKVGVESIPGEWRYEDGWPVKRLREQAWYPRPDGSLSKGRAPRAGFERTLDYKATVGTSNRYRVPHNPAELFSDQRADDAYSLSFTSAPLDADLEILGFPRAVLYISATAPVANWIVRLSDIAPDGASMLVAKGILPGTHREGHTDPKSLTPGEVYELAIDLKFNSWVFEPGHRIRLSVANADFPNIWPSPYPMTTTLYVGADRPSRVILPVCPPADRPRPDYAEPEPEPARGGATQAGPLNQWQNIRDEMTQTATVFRETLVADYPVPSEGEPITMSHFERRWCTASDADPARAILRTEGQRKVRRGDDEVAVTSRMSIESDASAFHLKVRSEVLMNGRTVRQKDWEERIPRDGI